MTQAAVIDAQIDDVVPGLRLAPRNRAPVCRPADICFPTSNNLRVLTPPGGEILDAGGESGLIGRLRRSPVVQKSAKMWSHTRFRRSLAKWKSNRQGRILMYHRVADVDTDPWGICVSPAHFAEQLEVLRRHCSVLPLRQFVQARQEGSLPPRAVAITFADGYADNLLNAEPLLDRNDLPATCFVIKGGIGSDREFFWDELDRIFLQPGTLPDALELRIDGQQKRWELGDAASYSDAEYQKHRGWRTWTPAPTARHEIYYAIWRYLQTAPFAEQQRILEQLTSWAGLDRSGRTSHRAMTAEEVAQMSFRGLVEIGAHTVTHPALTYHSAAVQHQEISESKLWTEKVIGCPVGSFSYPYGKYSARTIAIVREVGFALACVAFQSLIPRPFSPFRLPRLDIGDWDGEQFEKHV